MADNENNNGPANQHGGLRAEEIIRAPWQEQPSFDSVPAPSRGARNTKAYKQLVSTFNWCAEQAQTWVTHVAEKDPQKALEFTIKLAEFIIPKLSRQVIAGDNDGPVVIEIRHREEQ